MKPEAETAAETVTEWPRGETLDPPLDMSSQLNLIVYEAYLPHETNMSPRTPHPPRCRVNPLDGVDWQNAMIVVLCVVGAICVVSLSIMHARRRKRKRRVQQLEGEPV